MTPEEALVLYEEIAAFSGAMRVAACAGRWDEVIALERSCRPRVERLMREEPRGPLPSPLRERKADLIRRILDDDAEVRRRIEPQLAELEQLLGTARNRRRLHERYGDRVPGTDETSWMR